ncbi:Na+ ABC transporter permease [Cellvibrio zantedeschiae]|uniref:Na+ ABC transporter permease n=1 Tax=Cellvibrio zantedeschiae TaxID=1237077 RepID=A0ABQ3BET2_9GAMM|nr:ABC transporter permease [Cellvibrio zantedeschiae]GGY87223.1 Na+ ABC transporter permease [Cellvibrio zantedeschiae]
MLNKNSFRFSLTVYRKELRDALRDRRAMRMAFLPPLYFVAIFVGLVFFAVSMENDKKVAGVNSIPVYVEGEQNLPELVAWLREQGAVIKTVESGAYQQIKDKKIDFALIIPDEAKQKRAKGESAPVWLVYDGANQKLSSSIGFVRSQFYTWSWRVGSINLMARGLAPDVGTPVMLREDNIADEQKMSVYLLASVPLTLLLAAFIGSVGFSADMTAGERERRSLESLLITPASTFSVYLGKWLTSVSLTVVILIMQLVLLAIAFRFLPFNQLGLRVDVNYIDLINVFWVLVPVVFFAVALQLSLSIFAKSFKDAQSLIAGLVFVPMMLNFYTMFNPGVFHEWWLWVPVLGQAVVIKEILLGGAIVSFAFWKFWFVGLMITCLAFWVGIKQLRRPKIVYGQ